MPPIGVVGALGVVGPGGAGVVFSGLGERGEAIVWRAAGRGQGVFVGRRSCIVLVSPTAREGFEGVVWVNFVLSFALIQWTAIHLI